MKLLTLNTHSLIEDNYEQKLLEFTRAVSKELPDVIALQEVNQSMSAKEAADGLEGCFPANKNAVIRMDNHVYRAAKILDRMGIHYSWTWLPVKCGYGVYEEGIALMSRSPITAVSTPLVSGINDYYNWKTRKLLGICTENSPHEWFYSVHLGWWDDREEPFGKQWENTAQHMQKHEKVWLMGDFNSPAEVRNEGYDVISADGWQDSFLIAQQKDDGITVPKVIDGWRHKTLDSTGMRIDHIWCSEKADVKSSQVIFSGKNYPIVSDHYGVMVEVNEERKF